MVEEEVKVIHMMTLPLNVQGQELLKANLHFRPVPRPLKVTLTVYKKGLRVGQG